jgi:DNA-binding protein Fis
MNTALENTNSLQEEVTNYVKSYLDAVGDEKITHLHELFLEQIEAPLFQAVMESSKYNQVRAAKILGISRGTLRSKLIRYFDDKYCGKRSDS